MVEFVVESTRIRLLVSAVIVNRARRGKYWVIPDYPGTGKLPMAIPGSVMEPEER